MLLLTWCVSLCLGILFGLGSNTMWFEQRRVNRFRPWNLSSSSQRTQFEVGVLSSITTRCIHAFNLRLSLAGPWISCIQEKHQWLTSLTTSVYRTIYRIVDKNRTSDIINTTQINAFFPFRSPVLILPSPHRRVASIHLFTSHSVVLVIRPNGPAFSLETLRCESSSVSHALWWWWRSLTPTPTRLLVVPASTGARGYVPSSIFPTSREPSFPLRLGVFWALEKKWPGRIRPMMGRITGRQAFVTARLGSTTVQNTGSTMELLISVNESTMSDCMRMMLMMVILEDYQQVILFYVKGDGIQQPNAENSGNADFEPLGHLQTPQRWHRKKQSRHVGGYIDCSNQCVRQGTVAAGSLDSSVPVHVKRSANEKDLQDIGHPPQSHDGHAAKRELAESRACFEDS